MNILETLTRAQQWLATPYKALRHGVELMSQLYKAQTCANSAERSEIKRLTQSIITALENIRTACPYVPKDCYRVAFLPVATYDDETGETITPTDYIQYPTDCTLAQRLQLQYAEAERHFVGAKEPAAEEQPTNTQPPAPNTQETAPVPSDSSEIEEPILRRRRKSAE